MKTKKQKIHQKAKKLLAGFLGAALLCTSMPAAAWASEKIEPISENETISQGQFTEPEPAPQERGEENLREESIGGETMPELQPEIISENSENSIFSENTEKPENAPAAETPETDPEPAPQKQEKETPQQENAQASEDASGKCGKNAQWFYDSASKTLTISGKGAMYNYSSYHINPAPWKSIDFVSAKIESGITSIGYEAFVGCSNLVSISIPNSVSSIGSYAFERCSNLVSISIPNSVSSIGSHAFGVCSSLASISIPNSVSSISDSAFGGCSSLASISIPNSVSSIGDSAFYGCSSLTSISIPNSVSHIGSWAFGGCSSLTSISIPNSVSYIGSWVFWECANLISVYFHGNLNDFSSDMFIGSSVTAYYPSNNPTWTEEARKKFVRVRAWKKWLPDGSKTVTSIAGKQEHYLSGSVKYQTKKNASETINGDKTIKETAWDVQGNTALNGSLHIRSKATVTVEGALKANKITIEKEGTLIIRQGGKVTANEVLANGGWLTDCGGKIQMEQGLLITDRLVLNDRSSLSIKSYGLNGKVVVRDSMEMATNSKSCEFADGTLFIGKDLILNGNKKNFVAKSEDFHTVFYGKGNHTLNAKGSLYNLGAVYFTKESEFTSMDIGGSNYIKAATCTANETQWSFRPQKVLSAASSSEDWSENIETAFSGIAAKNAFKCTHSQLTGAERKFVESLAAVWINTLNTPLCEGFVESQDVEEELHFKLGKKSCILKCKGPRFSFGAMASVTLNVNNAENDAVIGMVANANVGEFSKKAQKYLEEKAKEEVIGYICGAPAKNIGKWFGVGENISSIVGKLVEKIAKKVCVNQKILQTNDSQEVKDIKKAFKEVKCIIKEPSKTMERAAFSENQPLREDLHETRSLSAVSDTVTDAWLKDQLISELGADAAGEPDFSKAGSITSLDLSEGYIQNLNGLQHFTNLKELNLANNEVQDLSPLAGLTKLESLDISGQFISSLYPISKLTRLTTLNAASNELSSLASLTSLANLRSLDVRGNQLETLSSLAGLTNLENLYASNNPLKDGNLAPLAALGKLSILDLEDCGILDLSGINARSLTKLYASNNEISSLQPLSAATYLKALDISNNGGLDLNPLTGCAALEELLISDNELDNLNAISKLASLTTLNLSQTYLIETDLDALSGLAELATLDISNNPIFGTGCLTTLSQLSKITVSDTALSDTDIDTLRESGKIVIGSGNTTPAQKLYFLDTQIQIDTGKTYWQDILCFPSGAQPTDIAWKSSHPAIAEVDSQGIVTGRSGGKANITASIENGRLTAFYTVTVTDPSASVKKKQPLKVTPNSLTLYKGKVAYVLKPSGAKGKVTYVSSNPKVAKVNASGKVTPVSGGKAEITIKAEGNNTYLPASCKVKVTVYGQKPAVVKNIKITPNKVKGTAKMSWKKVSAATGYQIQYGYKKNSLTKKATAKGSASSMGLKKLSRKKYIYVRIRAYRTEGGVTVYGNWSKTYKSSGKIK